MLDAAVAFGNVLRHLRLKAGLMQEQFGFEAKLRRTYVSILELDQQQPSLTTSLKLAGALNVAPPMLMRRVVQEMQRKRKPLR